MISPLKTIHTKNLQSHKDTLVELPETGIVAFTGNNSNGKSVIVKVLNAILSNDISKPKERRTLINKDVFCGSMELTRYDGVSLYVNIHVEAAQTYAELRVPGNDPVRRYLADKAIPELVREFGLHYNKEHEVSLNVHNDDDKFLFVNTKHAANYAALNAALTDDYAEESLVHLEETLKACKADIKSIESELSTQQCIVDSLTTCDEEMCETIIKQLMFIAANIKHLPSTPCPKVPLIPDVITMKEMAPIRKVEFPLVISLPVLRQNDLEQKANDVNDVLKGVCPTCKRAFFS